MRSAFVLRRPATWNVRAPHAAARGLLVATAAFYAAYLADLIPALPVASSVLPQLCISGLMALSLWLPFSSGQLSLAQAGFMAVGAYGSAWLTVNQGWPFLPALGAGALGTTLLGLVVSYPALRLRGVYLAIATLGVGEVTRAALLNTEAVGGAFGFSGIPRYTQTWMLVVAVAALCGVLAMLYRGRIGRAAWAVRTDETAAAALGISVTRVRVLTFALGAFIAGLAGGLQAHYVRFISPENYGLPAMVDWLVAVMLGGHEVFIGAVAGTVVLGTLPELLRFVSEWRLMIDGVLLVALLALRPKGLVTRELVRWTSAPPVAEGASPLEPRAAPQVLGAELLEVSHVGKRFGGIVALSDVTFAVPQGSIHGLIGPNGAGKSTLFNALTGLYRLDSGDIRLEGRSVVGLPPHAIVAAGVARTFQNIRLFRELSVLDNVLIGAHCRLRSGPLRSATGLDREEERNAAARARSLLALLGLADRAAHPAGALSYGEQRRIEIARALASEPRLLILDEPAAGMNEVERDSLAQLLRYVREQFGITVLVIEHDMQLVMSLCDRVTVLEFGHVLVSGTPAQVQSDPQVIRAYLGGAEDALG